VNNDDEKEALGEREQGDKGGGGEGECEIEGEREG
jgi:hypothetical protein